MSLGRRTASNLVNKQFNSPIKMYSPDSVQEALSKHAQALSNGAIGWAASSVWCSRTHEIIIACHTIGFFRKLYSLCTSVTMIKTGIIWIRHVARMGKRNQFERLHAMNWRQSSTHSWRQHYMEVSGHLHARTLHPREKDSPIFTEEEVASTAEAVWIIRRREKTIPIVKLTRCTSFQICLIL